MVSQEDQRKYITSEYFDMETRIDLIMEMFDYMMHDKLSPRNSVKMVSISRGVSEDILKSLLPDSFKRNEWI